MTFVKWPGGNDHMFHLIAPELAWYFDSHGVLLHTRVARRKADRGCWREVS